MIHQIVKKISTELERIAQYNISVERALDLMEASTESLDELVAINTMRESLQELKTPKSGQTLRHFPFFKERKPAIQAYHS